MEELCSITKEETEYYWVFFEKAYLASQENYYNCIKEAFGKTPLWDARAYDHLAEIPFKSFVTFNYDDQLPTAFWQKHKSDFSDCFSTFPVQGSATFFQPSDLVGHKQRLIAIHGCRNDDDPEWYKRLILKVSDYNAYYGDGLRNDGTYEFPALFDWWKNLLTSQPCVFIGTTLQEPGLSRVIDALLKDGNLALKNQRHIHLKHTSRFSAEPFYEPSGQTFGEFEQVLYDNLDDQFNGLLEVLSAFSNIPTSRPVAINPKRIPITVSDNFKF